MNADCSSNQSDSRFVLTNSCDSRFLGLEIRYSRKKGIEIGFSLEGETKTFLIRAMAIRGYIHAL